MTETAGDMLERVNAELHRYAVQKAVFCPTCNVILDERRSVFISTSGGAAISCSHCWSDIVGQMAFKYGPERANQHLDRLDIHYGAEIVVRSCPEVAQDQPQTPLKSESES